MEDVHARMKVVEARLSHGDERFEALSNEMQANTAMTQKISDDIQPLLSLVTDLAAGTRLLCRVALSISWVLKTIKEYWTVIAMILVFTAYMTNSTKLLEFAAHLLKA